MTLFWLLLAVAVIIVVTAVWKIHPLPVLLLTAFFFGVCNNFGVIKTINMISSGFGNTMKSIGIVIIAGTVIGAFMEQRGALKVIAGKIIALTGKKRTPLAMSIIGFLVSICIFCDSAFVILIGLWKKLGTMTGQAWAVGALALSMGLYAAHCFIPPTPGPLAAMAILSADFGRVLFFGSIAAAAATAAGYLYAVRAGKNEVLAGEKEAAGSEGDPDEKTEKPFQYHWSAAFLPIVVPLLLIGGNSFCGIIKGTPAPVASFFSAAGNPVAALTVGAFIAVFFIGRWQRSELTTGGIMGKAIIDAANILLITGAGGAFGEVLKQVDFRHLMPAASSSAGVFSLLFPLIFAAILKIAQGSSTLAILTAASITVPLLDTLGLGTPVMRALSCCAVCCGGMMVSHTNDSYFWVVTRFSGMNVRQGLKLQTLGSLVSGVTGAAVLLILAVLFR
ncbi:MAG: GntP family permease [Lentisphaeria bacterium]|nr:GntP family permease [Lentisphaeria bacterium]